MLDPLFQRGRICSISLEEFMKIRPYLKSTVQDLKIDMNAWSTSFDNTLSEIQLQNEFCTRIRATFGKGVEIKPQQSLTDGSFLNLLLKISPLHESETIVEMKRLDVGLNLDIFDQLACYGQTIFSENPKLSVLKLILCDGHSAYVGHIFRTDHSHMEVLIAEEPLILYSKMYAI